MRFCVNEFLKFLEYFKNKTRKICLPFLLPGSMITIKKSIFSSLLPKIRMNSSLHGGNRVATFLHIFLIRQCSQSNKFQVLEIEKEYLFRKRKSSHANPTAPKPDARLHTFVAEQLQKMDALCMMCIWRHSSY